MSAGVFFKQVIHKQTFTDLEKACKGMINMIQNPKLLYYRVCEQQIH